MCSWFSLRCLKFTLFCFLHIKIRRRGHNRMQKCRFIRSCSPNYCGNFRLWRIRGYMPMRILFFNLQGRNEAFNLLPSYNLCLKRYLLLRSFKAFSSMRKCKCSHRNKQFNIYSLPQYNCLNNFNDYVCSFDFRG